jgi:transcriptional regulator with XRE-family HTH domain
VSKSGHGSTLTPKSEDAERLGKLFREVRERRRVSLLATAAGIDRTINVVRWHEAGARMLRIDELLKAARLFGVPVVTLIEN